MPLSEHEKRLLDEIEQTLRSDDPGLASSLRSARPAPRLRTMIPVAVACFILGVGLLVAALDVGAIAAAILGVAGFAFIVAGVDLTLRIVARTRDKRTDRPSRLRRRRR